MALVKWWNHIKKLKGKVKTRNDILDLELIIIKEHRAKCKGRTRGRNKGRHRGRRCSTRL